MRAATIHIVSEQGMPMPLGSIVDSLMAARTSWSTMGSPYLTDIPDKVSAEVQNENDRCHINFFRNTSDPVVCQPILGRLASSVQSHVLRCRPLRRPCRAVCPHVRQTLAYK